MKKEWKNPELLNCTLGAPKETLCYCSEGEALAAAIATNIGGELFYVYGASSNVKRNLI